MLVLAPQDLTYAQLANAALTVTLTPVAVKIIKSVRHKMRVTKQLAPIPGPKGHWLFGTMLDLVKNLPRIYEYQECTHGVLRRIPTSSTSDDDLAKRNDILSLFINKTCELDDAKKQGGTASILGIGTLRAVFVTFIIAGWDNTSSLITYLLYMLAQYPDMQQKVYDESSKLNKTALTYDDLKSLKYLDAVAMETLRVYPSLPFNTKVAAKDDRLPDGTSIPAGTQIITHRGT
uniref:Cytochrome P450 n=1 Tax=Globisporangium ultimum (strain ATCC 200006 / CBS 805.95 / DAOM BR144) TaxID=431595 RepID=K3X3T3_GLOUD